MDLSQADVRAALDYSKGTGIFRWRDHKVGRQRRVPSNVVGQIAGWLDPDTGYWKVWLCGKNHLAHRLAWLWVEGFWPSEQVDHVDLNRANNRWLNLRLAASQSFNNGNTILRSTNTSGFKGVSWSASTGKWWAQIKCNKVHHNLGYFSDPKSAAQAYDQAAVKLFGAFARINFPVQERGVS